MYHSNNVSNRMRQRFADKQRFTDRIAAMIVQGNTLTDATGESYLLLFADDGRSFDAFSNVHAAIYWPITFLSKGVLKTWEKLKRRLFLYYSCR